MVAHYLPVPLAFARMLADPPPGQGAADLTWRLFWTAFPENRGDGHAPFKQGELAKRLGIDGRNLPRTLRGAVDLGLIRPESTARCVVLPFTHTYGGTEHQWCRWHEGRARKLRPVATKLTPELRRQTTTTVTELRRERTKFGDVSAGHSAGLLLLPVAPATHPLTTPNPACVSA